MTRVSIQTAALPATASALLLVGMAAQHPQAGAVTQGLYVLTVPAFFVQLALAFRRA